jgi:hypothetical protein
VLSIKQFLVAAAVFLSAGVIIIAVTLMPALRNIADEQFTGLAIVFSRKMIATSLAVVIVLLVASCFIAKKLVR